MACDNGYSGGVVSERVAEGTRVDGFPGREIVFRVPCESPI